MTRIATTTDMAGTTATVGSLEVMADSTRMADSLTDVSEIATDGLVVECYSQDIVRPRLRFIRIPSGKLGPCLCLVALGAGAPRFTPADVKFNFFEFLTNADYDLGHNPRFRFLSMIK